MNAENSTGARTVKRELAAISFAMDDVRLFLDTHPCDEAALAAYNELRERRESIVQQYAHLVGPVDFYGACGACCWNWLRAPWPWETEECNDVEL